MSPLAGAAQGGAYAYRRVAAVLHMACFSVPLLQHFKFAQCLILQCLFDHTLPSARLCTPYPTLIIAGTRCLLRPRFVRPARLLSALRPRSFLSPALAPLGPKREASPRPFIASLPLARRHRHIIVYIATAAQCWLLPLAIAVYKQSALGFPLLCCVWMPKRLSL